MIRFIFALFLLCALAPASTAQAAQAFANEKVGLRAGPDGGYPVVDTLKRGERVELLGCIAGYQWCEVETRSGEHGWVYAHYLDTHDTSGRNLTIIQTGGNGLKIITFSPRNYWSRYYRTKDFYPYRDRWLPRNYARHRDDDRPVAPPRPRPQLEPSVEAPPPKIPPIPIPSRNGYNPLCPIGQTTC